MLSPETERPEVVCAPSENSLGEFNRRAAFWQGV